MPSIRLRFKHACASVVFGLAVSLAGAGHSLAASVNVLPGNSAVSSPGLFGVLRTPSVWAPGPLAPLTSLTDGSFLPAASNWNVDTVWWDEAPLVNPTTVPITIQLSGAFTLERFVVQADDNEAYRVDYWNGAAWLLAYTAPALQQSFGMQTRDSGLLAPITTDRLRITAVGGDGYYSLGEIEAYGRAAVIPLPGALLLFATGAGAFGVFARRRRSAR